ncbi:MAG TPA: methyltransferase domain-containing protein [Burkholderiaceae bacterium]|nr:methyltransferase domain-containing protein [Burkholderiaceae bacterium]HPE00547.1 methyltransferase domain-containing protein [Burkholderiaceae bacterium]
MTSGVPGAPDFAQFLDSPPGRYVLAWEQAQIDRVVGDVFGYHALQIGLPQLDALRENRMPLRLRVGEAERGPGQGAAPCPAVVAGYEELPFATQSIDLVVLPHTLEFAREPHQVLREVDRVLVPEGQVLIVGFNPASLWGLRQWMVRLGAHPYLPREGQFIHLARIKDWLKLLSFEVQLGRFGAYVPWARSEQWLARWGFLDRAGDRWWPVLGSLYMVTAVKRVRGMRLIGPAWKRPEAASPTLAPVTTRALLFGQVAPLARPHSANDPDQPADCA